MKGLLIFLAGALAGSVGTLIYVKECVVPKIEEDVREEIKNDKYYDDFSAEPAEEVNYMPEDNLDESKFASRPEKRPAETFEKVNYTQYSGTVSKEAKKEEKPIPNDISGTENTEPYLIDAESYDEYSSYSAHSFEVYADGIVLDEDTEEILDADPELVFGKLAMDELKKAPDGMIYVRDDSKKSDYCLERCDIPFDGLSPTDDEEWG